MNNTGKSFLRESSNFQEQQSPTRASPARISAHKKLPSPSLAGGYALNSPQNDPTENALARENNRVAGFGPGMGAALIGNAARRGNSLTVNDVKDNRTALGSIGWGSANKNLEQGIWRRLLPEMPHK